MSARVTQMDKCFCQDIPEWETQQWCKTKHVPIWTDADAYELSYITKVCMNQYNMPHEKHMNVSGFPPEVADFQPSCSRAENLSFFSVQLNRGADRRASSLMWRHSWKLKTGMSEMETVKSVWEDEPLWNREMRVKESTEEKIAVIRMGSNWTLF